VRDDDDDDDDDEYDNDAVHTRDDDDDDDGDDGGGDARCVPAGIAMVELTSPKYASDVSAAAWFAIRTCGAAAARGVRNEQRRSRQRRRLERSSAFAEPCALLLSAPLGRDPHRVRAEAKTTSTTTRDI